MRIVVSLVMMIWEAVSFNLVVISQQHTDHSPRWLFRRRNAAECAKGERRGRCASRESCATTRSREEAAVDGVLKSANCI